MLILKLTFLLVFLSFNVEAASLPERNRILRENKLLKAEYRLAMDRQIYLLFKPTEKKIYIKVRGTVLKELPVEGFKFWGPPIQPKDLKLLKKSSFFKPKRTKIKPKKDEEVNPSELNALEVDEMPVRYCLRFDNGVWLYIRPNPDGVISSFFTLLSSLRSYIITKPMITIWNALQRKAFTDIEIFLNKKDAKSLYWILPEGSHCIFYDG